jgi:carbamoyl-phosphate synthase small subunit
VSPRLQRVPARLVLQDGAVFEGEAIGARADEDATVFSGEVVFNTALTGYQEILTDPSYAGQVIAFTYPHIGNYGVTRADDEAARPHCRGVVVRDLAHRPSNWRAEHDLGRFLSGHGVGGISGVDTRRLTRHIRESGAMPCAFGTASEVDLLEAARREPGTLGQDLVKQVTTERSYVVGGGPYRVVAYDFGIKRAILDQLTAFAVVEVVPATTKATDVLGRRPDGVFLSNGPGDPAALGHLTAEVRALIGAVPLFGVCLGHQLLATALGGRTYKLAFGHHGANHPVRRLATGRTEIACENHGYAVEPRSVEGAAVTHVNLNDDVVEGIAVAAERAFGVQYHPEAGPGPHDGRYLFGEFRQLMDAAKGTAA